VTTPGGFLPGPAGELVRCARFDDMILWRRARARANIVKRVLKQAEALLRTPRREPALSDCDIRRFMEGTHCRLYQKLGAQPAEDQGTQFTVWAPNAEHIYVIGDFNNWNETAHPLTRSATGGLWTGCVQEASVGDAYAYLIAAHGGDFHAKKADPFAVRTKTPDDPASVIADLNYPWSDAEWLESRKHKNLVDEPVSIYEVHLPSWGRNSGNKNRPLNYRDIAPALANHAVEMGFTHVELMPVMEHPDPETWGYKVTGFFAPACRYGLPQDLMYLVDHLHRRGIGVILDWSPAHFAPDGHGLYFFDGGHLFEHPDQRRGYHPQWTSYIFNYERPEVRSFLLSVAFFWLDRYHFDGFRMDAVTSMLYLDYARAEWLPNHRGGKENIGAISFMQDLNRHVHQNFPGVETFAEESTAWPKVSRPVADGLGFGFKWDMGWANDILRYLARNPIYRKYHHGELTFRSCYYAQENFLLPLSHDDVAHGKGSLVSQMPGDEWQQLASFRLLLGYLFAQPGKKLLFMGNEFGQLEGWRFDRDLNWTLLSRPAHSGVMQWTKDLNQLYRNEPALYETDCREEGFEWIDGSDHEQSVVSFLRRPRLGNPHLLAVFNFTPVLRTNYRLGVPLPGVWRELLNSDSTYYGGQNHGNLGKVCSSHLKWHGRDYSVSLTLPPLSALILKHTGRSNVPGSSRAEVF
jgi:1,4-alpha-glucan branching enzyme